MSRRFILSCCFLIGLSCFSIKSSFASFRESSFKVLTKSSRIKLSEDYERGRERVDGFLLDILETDSACLRGSHAISSRLGEIFWFKKSEGLCSSEVIASLEGITYFRLKKQKDSIYVSYQGVSNRKSFEDSFEVPLMHIFKKETINRSLFSNWESNKVLSHIWLKLKKTVGGKPVEKDEKKTQICHQLNSRCETIHRFNCDQICLDGWIDLLGGGCVKYPSKICSKLKCGQAASPACDGGVLINPLEKKCPLQKRRGVCAQGLEAYCSDGVVYCGSE